MSNASSALRRHKFPLAVAVAGAIGISVLAAVWGETPPTTVSRPVPNSAVPTARDTLGPAAVVPLAEQPPAKIFIDPPLRDSLANGVAVIQYRIENLRVMPVFGQA